LYSSCSFSYLCTACFCFLYINIIPQ
jgi:hypothetical protein